MKILAGIILGLGVLALVFFAVLLLVVLFSGDGMD